MWEQFCPPRNIWQHLEAFLVVTSGWWGDIMLLASSYREVEDTANMPCCTGQLPPQRETILPKMFILLRLRKPEKDIKIWPRT